MAQSAELRPFPVAESTSVDGYTGATTCVSVVRIPGRPWIVVRTVSTRILSSSTSTNAKMSGWPQHAWACFTPSTVRRAATTSWFHQGSTDTRTYAETIGAPPASHSSPKSRVHTTSAAKSGSRHSHAWKSKNSAPSFIPSARRAPAPERSGCSARHPAADDHQVTLDAVEDGGPEEGHPSARTRDARTGEGSRCCGRR
jgi:hypothetical protein